MSECVFVVKNFGTKNKDISQLVPLGYAILLKRPQKLRRNEDELRFWCSVTHIFYVFRGEKVGHSDDRFRCDAGCCVVFSFCQDDHFQFANCFSFSMFYLYSNVNQGPRIIDAGAMYEQDFPTNI